MESDEENMVSIGVPLMTAKAPRVNVFHPAHNPSRHTTVATTDWKPSTFVSSRSTKGANAAVRKARPEDFMDEADLSEFGIAPRTVSTQSEFAETKRQKPTPAKSTWLGDVEELVVPTSHTVGDRFLKLMGWKEGQGVGPRVDASTLARLNAKQRSKAFQAALSADHPAIEDETGASIPHVTFGAKARTFAPRDTQTFEFAAKNDVHGIGYSGISRKEMHLEEAPKRNMAGFGVGVFDEEDEDIYEQDSMRNYDRFVGLDFEPQSGASGPAKPRRQAVTYGGLEPVLPGFVRGTHQQFATMEKVPLPVIPSDFQPIHKFATPGPAFSLHKTAVPSKPQQPLTAHQRAAILGEERMVTPTAQAVALPGPPSQPVQATGTAKLAEATKPGVFQPFANDATKRERYHKFLQGQYEAPADMPKLERDRELMEFSKSAELFRPMSAMIASRFAPAGGSATPPAAAVTTAASQQATALQQQAEPVDERLQAVQMKMFGPLTRVTEVWHPHRLVCKRFNVPDPYPESGLVGVVASKAGVSKGRFTSGGFESQAMPAGLQQPSVLSSGATPANTEASEPLPDTQTVLRESQEAPVPERPAMSIFKSIFSESESESSSEDEERSEDKGRISETPATMSGRSGDDLGQMQQSAREPAGTAPTTSTTTPAPRLTLVNPSSINLVAKAQEAAFLQARKQETTAHTPSFRPVFQSTKPIGPTAVSSSSESSSESESEEETHRLTTAKDSKESVEERHKKEKTHRKVKKDKKKKEKKEKKERKEKKHKKHHRESSKERARDEASVSRSDKVRSLDHDLLSRIKAIGGADAAKAAMRQEERGLPVPSSSQTTGASHPTASTRRSPERMAYVTAVPRKNRPTAADFM